MCAHIIYGIYEDGLLVGSPGNAETESYGS